MQDEKSQNLTWIFIYGEGKSKTQTEFHQVVIHAYL